MTDFYLFLDLETTDLDPSNLTVLEAAWTVTDSDFRQLTPLTSRYTYIPTSEKGAARPRVHGWEGNVIEFVRNMHEESHLFEDWLSAYVAGDVIGAPALDDALAASVWRSGWQKGDTVYLAGAGVSHFDRLVMDAWDCSLTKGGTIHYRAADVSSAISLLGIKAPKTISDLIYLTEEFMRPEFYSEVMLDSYAEGFDQSRSGLTTLERVVLHRAAPDVAWGLVLSRCLRAMVS